MGTVSCSHASQQSSRGQAGLLLHLLPRIEGPHPALQPERDKGLRRAAHPGSGGARSLHRAACGHRPEPRDLRVRDRGRAGRAPERGRSSVPENQGEHGHHGGGRPPWEHVRRSRDHPQDCGGLAAVALTPVPSAVTPNGPGTGCRRLRPVGVSTADSGAGPPATGIAVTGMLPASSSERPFRWPPGAGDGGTPAAPDTPRSLTLSRAAPGLWAARLVLARRSVVESSPASSTESARMGSRRYRQRRDAASRSRRP